MQGVDAAVVEGLAVGEGLEMGLAKNVVAAGVGGRIGEKARQRERHGVLRLGGKGHQQGGGEEKGAPHGCMLS